MTTAVYTTRKTDLQKIPNILKELEINEDYFLVTNDLISEEMDIPCINFYHIINETKRTLLFTNYEDYNDGAYFFLGPKMLLIDKKDIIHIDSNMFQSNTQVFVIDNKKIRKAKNAELQPILR